MEVHVVILLQANVPVCTIGSDSFKPCWSVLILLHDMAVFEDVSSGNGC